jgi:hypothetical protein
MVAPLSAITVRDKLILSPNASAPKEGNSNPLESESSPPRA